MYSLVYFLFLLTDWCNSRRVSTDFEMIPVEELAKLLREFYGAVRQRSGQLYSLPSYRGLRAAIQRHLNNPPFSRNINIISGPQFSRANHVFDGVIKTMKVEGRDVSQPHPPIAKGDLEKMFQSGQLAMTSPTSLQRLVWFYLEFHFCRRGSEGLRELRKDSFIVKEDDEGVKYVTMTYNEKTKNHPGGETSIGGKSTLKRMYATGTNICPVAAVELYVSKLSPESDDFFQRPRKQVDQDDQMWYTKQPLGVNTLGSMLSRISKDADLSRVYTNHSVRATTITALNDAGFETRVIMAVSGHRSEASVRNYCTDINQAQKRQTSNALQVALGNKIPMSPWSQNHPAAGGSSIANPSQTAVVQHNTVLTPNAVEHLFQNCKFKAPVVINFNTK